MLNEEVDRVVSLGLDALLAILLIAYVIVNCEGYVP